MWRKLTLMIAALFYILAVLMANLTATLFLPFEIAPGTGILVSVGTLVFGLTFTQRDRMHKKGKPFVYRVIFVSAILNLAMLVSLRYAWGDSLLGYLNAKELDWFAQATAMLMENGWRVFLASFLAIIFAESIDTEVFHYYRERSWIGRVIRSNAISIPVDSILFNLIAFAGSSFFPPIVLTKVIFGEILSKFVVGAVYALIYPGRSRVKSEAEN